MSGPTTIKCNCGDVQIELSGAPVAQFFCHCDDCQAVHGAAYVPVSMYPADQVKVTSGQPAMWQLRTTPRASCPRCGTRMFAEVASMGLRGVVAQRLPPDQFKPLFHIQCQHARTPVRDELPHFKGYPAAFGGVDDRVNW